MSFAVIGTDTEVGKTVVSAALLWRLAGKRPLAYWKPIATGSAEGRDAETVGDLLGVGRAGAPAVEILPETYLFREPISPHVAARHEGRVVDPHRVVRDFAAHRRAVPGRALLVEGVGGLLVPLTDDGFLLTGLLAALALPCVLVARSSVGTINHTLLALEAARVRGLRIAGVVMSGAPHPENRRAIERFGQVEVLGELPFLAPLSSSTLAAAARALDPDDRLVELLAEAPRESDLPDLDGSPASGADGSTH
jgi:malonyl-CoA O-methyltransferase